MNHPSGNVGTMAQNSQEPNQVLASNHFPIAAHMRELENTALSTVLLERDCLAFGLSTFRTSGQTFIAADPHGEQIAFNKAGTVLNSRPAAPLTQNKHSTRLVLQHNGVPVPRGRRFDQSSVAAALAYAEELATRWFSNPCTVPRAREW